MRWHLALVIAILWAASAEAKCYSEGVQKQLESTVELLRFKAAANYDPIDVPMLVLATPVCVLRNALKPETEILREVQLDWSAEDGSDEAWVIP